MARLLIIGAGGVSTVVVDKCARQSDLFADILLASRTESKCKALAARYDREIQTASVDADNVSELTALMKDFQPDLALHVALPYQDLSIMDACLSAGVNYLDTANYEPPDEAKFCYQWQWDYHDRFVQAELMALLGCGFDPGQTSIYVAHALKHHFQQIDSIDIIDCNAGDHGLPFATNFNPEINIREVTARGKYWENGSWVETDPLSVCEVFDFPEGIGEKKMYLMYHEEIESLARFIPDVKKIRFWMTFSDRYLTHLRVLENVGMTGIDPVDYDGTPVVPLKLLKKLLPDPASLGPRTKGKTCIGCLIRGTKKDGKAGTYYIYNVCDHQECFKETGAQAVSYTTGVPAALGTWLMCSGIWTGRGVFNVEQMDPDPFMQRVGEWGLPWKDVWMNA
jgi:saccharopine dehydrogenase (NAD+, L-lysine-forming)